MGFRKKEKKRIFHQKRNEKEQSNSEKACFTVSTIEVGLRGWQGVNEVEETANIPSL